MKRNLGWVCVIVLTAILGIGITSPAHATGNGKHAGGSSMEGTWKLVSRKLADGTTLTAPNIIGLQSFSKDMRNFNIGWVDNAGKHTSFSVISTYKLTDKDYTETVLYSSMNDESGTLAGKPTNGPVYEMTSQSKTVPVNKTGSKLTWQMPFDPPQITLDGSTLTATLQGGFTDTWQKEK